MSGKFSIMDHIPVVVKIAAEKIAKDAGAAEHDARTVGEIFETAASIITAAVRS